MLNTRTPSRALGERLIDRKAIARDLLESMLDREAKDGTPLPRLLLEGNVVPEKELIAALAEQLDVEFVDFSVTAVHPDAVTLLPADQAWQYHSVPVRTQSGQLVVAMTDPLSAGAVAALEAAAGVPVRPAAASRDELARVLRGVYGPAPAGTHGVEPRPELGGMLDASVEPAHGPTADDTLHLADLLECAVQLGASDLHLSSGIPPTVRLHGLLQPMAEFEPLNATELRRMIYDILTQRQRERFEEDLELDTSYGLPNVGRFRVNVFVQRDAVGAVLRVVPASMMTLEQLGLPPVVATLAELPRGLVLVTGPTGSGKSTTLAALIHQVNSTRPLHIMTVEDPIEFLHQHRRALVNQREVGEDTHSFASALKHVLRQDPDVILVGEMRDLETVSAAITAAETGHLVFATLHTQDAPQTVDRVIDVFPAHQQQQIRVQLAASLQAVVTQQLLPTRNGTGRAVASEVLIVTPAVRNLIREGKTHQIASLMQVGSQHGMQTMDQSLAALVRTGRVDASLALERTADEQSLRKLLGLSGGALHG